MVLVVFNSSVVSGPETLMIPSLRALLIPTAVLFLYETRLGTRCDSALNFAKEHGVSSVSRIDVTSRLDFRAIQTLRAWIKKEQPQVVHAQDFKASVYVWLACCLLAHPPRLISTHHGVVGAQMRGGRVRLFETIYVRWVLPHFDRVLCVCQSDRQSLLARGLSPKKVYVHSNGVDRMRIQSEERITIAHQIRKVWGVPTEPLILGVVARLSPEKCHDVILKVLANVRKSTPHLSWILLCFGEGQEAVRLKALTYELNLEQNVIWMGYRKNVTQEFAGFDLLISLSAGEGLPITFLESGWAQTPIFSTDVGGVSDLIKDGVTGVLIPTSYSIEQMANQLIKTLQDQVACLKMGQALQRKVESQFSQKVWLKILSDHYQDVLGALLLFLMD